MKMKTRNWQLAIGDWLKKNTRRYRSGFCLLLIAYCLLPLSGCASLKKKDSAVHAGAVTADSIAQALNALEKVNEDLYDARPRLVGYFETIAISEGVRAATIANDTFTDRLKALKQANTNDPAQVASYFADLSAALDNLNRKGVLGVKNPTAKARLSAAFQLVAVAANAVASSLGIPPDAQPGPRASSFQLPASGLTEVSPTLFLLQIDPADIPIQEWEVDKQPAGLLRTGLAGSWKPEAGSSVPLLGLDALALAQLMGLAIQLFGAGSGLVKQIQFESGMSDDELFAAAEAVDQKTRDAVAAHLEAVKKEFPEVPSAAPTEGI